DELTNSTFNKTSQISNQILDKTEEKSKEILNNIDNFQRNYKKVFFFTRIATIATFIVQIILMILFLFK
ncbi:MAG TPA: hypothetical protein DCL74_05810, partial [Succinivibrionaceae bacterium]|nr:hypothetical protein [Succinivibrionaceae bacterium]